MEHLLTRSDRRQQVAANDQQQSPPPPIQRFAYTPEPPPPTEVTLPDGWRDAVWIAEIMQGVDWRNRAVILHENPKEISDIINKIGAQSRADSLNNLESSRAETLIRLQSREVTLESLQSDLNTKSKVDHYFEMELRAENPEYRRQIESRMEATAIPSDELRAIRADLYSWLELREQTGPETNYLLMDNGKWVVDDEAIEKLIVGKGYRMYLAPDKLPDLRNVVKLCHLLTESGMPEDGLFHVKVVDDNGMHSPRRSNPNWLGTRIESVDGKFQPKAGYFLQ